jgi:hypothetical protein
MEPGACAAWAEELAGALEAEHAGRRVSWISIHDVGGDYDAILDDGTHLTGEGR